MSITKVAPCQPYSMVDHSGSRDILHALRKQVRTWRTPEQLPAVLDLLARCPAGEGDGLVDAYVDYLLRLDRAQTVDGRTVAEWLDEARSHDPRLAKLLDRR